MGFESLLAPRTRLMGASAIREILKVVSQPGVVSLAGGIPAPESFPMDVFRELIERVLSRHGSAALQYDRTEGFGLLQEALAARLRLRGIVAPAASVLVTSGSQGTLDAVGKLLIAPGDAVAVESPTYLGALQAWNPYEPRYLTMETDDDGVLPESLDRVLSTEPVKLVYLIPTFQNPTGRTLSLDRRRRIAEIIVRRGALLLEDDPYSDLRYRGTSLPPIRSMAPDNVIYTSTLSKTLAPGLRIGFVVAPPPLDRWLVIAKQGTDLHTSTFSQALAAEYLSGGYLDRHLPRIVELYRPRQEAMLQALAEHFGGGYHWSKPEGGMFIWVEGPPGLDTDAMSPACIRRGVAYVPGRYFYAAPNQGLATMRLNYTMSEEPVIREAIRTLSDVLRQGTRQAELPRRQT